MSTRYVASRYNFFFPLDDGAGILAYNALANALVVVATDVYRRFDSLAQLRIPFEPDPILAPLFALGFAVPESVDELAAIRQESRKMREMPDTLGLTIAPTLSCNFACAYCFQDHPRSYMSPAVQDALVRFVGMQGDRLQRLDVTWYGGEPILAIKVVVRLSEAFARLATQHGFTWSPAAMVTNGWGLTRQNCVLLQGCNIGLLQVTLDGVGAVHDKRRMQTNGAATFDRIIENLSHAVELLPHTELSVRVNLEQENQESLQAVAEHIASLGLGKRVRVYPGQVEPYTHHSMIKAGLSDQQFYELRRRHDLSRTEQGVLPAQVPSLKAGPYCCAQRKHAYLISPTGALFKCWAELSLDESRAVGHLLRDVPNTGTASFGSIFDEFDITDDPECAACKVLPICGGGCMWVGMARARDFDRPAKVHSPYLFGDNLERAVRLRYEASKRRGGNPVATHVLPPA